MTTPPKTTVLEYAIDQLKKHGIVVALLALAVYWLVNRQDKLEAKIDNCNAELTRFLDEDRARMIKVIESNTQVIQRIENKIN